MPYLIVYRPHSVATSFELHDEFRIGRGKENDLVLSDNHVSREHATVCKSESGFTIADLGSTHGLRVNGATVASHHLHDGDHIQIGKVLLRFTVSDESIEVLHHQSTEIPLPSGQYDVQSRRLALLFEISNAIGSLESTERILGTMLDAILEVFQCERGLAVLMAPSRSAGLRVCRPSGDSTEEIVVSKTMLDAMIEDRSGIIVRADRGRAANSIIRRGVRTAMGAPLQLSDGTVIGIVYVDVLHRHHVFSVDDLTYLTALSHLTSAAIHSAEQYQRAAQLAEVAAGDTDEILGDSAAIVQLLERVARYAAADPSGVLIRGESGTGKELVARRIHRLSERAAEPFVAINSAAIPDSMIESELFGHVAGAFTGAVADKRGKFELADRGTLFLDEIGDLSATAQAKLLRILEDGVITRVGAEEPRTVDVRVVAATNRDLAADVATHRFREDLYYRLNVLELVLPPLRERGEDVVVLARAFLDRTAARMGQSFHGFSEAAERRLREYQWPGNVRELKNEIERAVVVCDGPVIEVDSLSPRIVSDALPPVETTKGSLADRYAALEHTERELVRQALLEAGGNISKAARSLRITRIMMKRRIDRFGIER